MPRTPKQFLTPGWIGLHALVWTAAVAMVFLGRWQLDVSNSKHFDLQNFGYALQWWAFSAFGIFLWARAIRDSWRGTVVDVSTGGQLVVRNQAGGVAYVGPAELVAPATAGAEPVVYLGYVMPQSTTSPVRSDGDPMHGAYNDYLWQLALADGAGADRVDGVGFGERRTDTGSAPPVGPTRPDPSAAGPTDPTG